MHLLARGRARRVTASIVSAAVILGTVLSSGGGSSPAFAETNFTITGRGWGHGIGLSQWGAQGLAKDEGWDYQRILGHYYQQTSIATTNALTVKVNLDKDAKARTSWRIRSGSDGRPLTMIDQSTPSDRTTLDTDSPYWITVSGGNVRVHTETTNASGAPAPGPVIRTFSGAAYATTGGSSYLVQVLSASGPFSGTGIRWRGNLVFAPSGSSSARAIDYVEMERYLYGVVPRESPSSFEMEALKAQAVAARSYAYTSALNGATLYCTVQSQVYNGHSRGTDSHETTRTNLAVDATRNQVVVYGGEVVRTYFSSSSGGHTANIEDVWVTSEPKPYYTGVTDADGPYPNGTAWASPIRHTGTSLAEAIRAYDFGNNNAYDYSSPAPASVVSYSAERATSGHVRYIELRWSDGRSYRMRGTTFQSALHLKSTKYYIGAEYPPPLVTRRYPESDPRIAYGGAWHTANNEVLLGGWQAYASASGATCLVTFTGTGMRWIGNKAATYGKANVYVDGTYNKTVDLYAPRTVYKQYLWSIGGLSLDDTHTVTIRVLGSRNGASTGTTVAVDGVDIYDGYLAQAPQPVARFEESDARIALTGSWMNATSSALSGGAHVYSERGGARAVVTFVGRGVAWIGSRSARGGTARVSVDGGAARQVDLFAETTSYIQQIWSTNGLPFGRHTVVIDAAKAANPASLGQTISLDAIEVTGGAIETATLPAARIEDRSASIRWSGTWKSGSSSVLSGGTQHWSAVKGSTATLGFSGTSVKLSASRATTYGKAAVLLDGRQVSVIDLYSPRPAYRQIVFARSGLSGGSHTLAIRVLGTARAGARGTNVSIDAFDVTGVGAERE